MANSTKAPVSHARKPNLPALNGRNVRHLTYVKRVGRTVRAALASVAAVGLIVGIGVGLPAYGDALGEAQQVERELLTRQSFEAPVAASLTVERDSYDATDPPLIVWPVPAGTRIASYYGPRTACAAGCSSFHEGVDFDPGNGAAVGSIAAGIVIDINRANYSALGQHVWIKHHLHGQDVISVYAHLQQGSIGVSVGESVDRKSTV